MVKNSGKVKELRHRGPRQVEWAAESKASAERIKAKRIFNQHSREEETAAQSIGRLENKRVYHKNLKMDFLGALANFLYIEFTLYIVIYRGGKDPGTLERK